MKSERSPSGAHGPSRKGAAACPARERPQAAPWGDTQSVHVLDSISDEASGPSYSVPRLCGELDSKGVRTRLLTVGEQASAQTQCAHQSFPADLSRLPILGKLRFSRALFRALVETSGEATILHVHGLWRMSNVYPSLAARRSGQRLVLSPRGMLGEAALQFSRREKQLFWGLAQGRAVRSAHCIHATSRQEYQDIRDFGLHAPVAIIPNGIDVQPGLPRRLRKDRADC